MNQNNFSLEVFKFNSDIHNQIHSNKIKNQIAFILIKLKSIHKINSILVSKCFYSTFKETVNNLNEMNRKLYDENQQFKERNIEQRQQIEHFHVLFQENQQKTEHTLTLMRKERDEAYQHENDLKRRMQHAMDSKQQETFLTINSLKEKLDEFKANEAQLYNDLNNTKTQMQQEKSANELLEKQIKQLEKDCGLLNDNWTAERNELNKRMNELNTQLEQTKKLQVSEKQKLDDKYMRERDELKVQLKELEKKIDEVTKEKTQLSTKCSQLAEGNRVLETQLQDNQTLNSKNEQELK